MSLSVLKIAEWTRSNSTDESDVLVLLDKRDTLFIKQCRSGETGTEYLKKVILDLANKTASETVIYSATDGIACAGLKIFGKNITTRRFGGYGMVGGDCNTKGDIIDLDDPSNILCLCDGAANCNLTSNVAKLLYDPVSGKMIADGGCSGRWIWIIDPSNLSIIGRVSESWIRSRSNCNIEIVPRDDEKVFVVIASQSPVGTKYLRIGLVDIDDIIDNASSYVNVDELGSWEELFSTSNYYSGCWVRAFCNGYKIHLHLNPGTGAIRAIYDPVSNTITETGDNILRAPIWRGWYAVDTNNQKHIVYEEDGVTAFQEISDSEANDGRNVALWFSLLTNTSTQEVIFKGLSPDGNSVPWVEWDFENNKFRVIDLLTGNPISMDVILAWSRLQTSLTERATLPYIANNRASKVTVNDWTDIPNPPTNNVRVLYVIPDFIEVGV